MDAQLAEAERLNDILKREAPAAHRCLSPLARRAAFPKGIPWQASQASETEINATVGQVTDGFGQPMPPELLQGLIGDLDPRSVFLYPPMEGPRSVRTAWLRRQRALAGGDAAPALSPPVTSHGLTHSLSLASEMFSDDQTDLIVPAPAWGNYHLVFRLHAQARLVEYPFFRDGRFNVEGLADCLSRVRHKAIVVLNFPGNPSGYTPSRQETAEIVRVLHDAPQPLVAVCDDAYQGWVYEPGLMVRSIFWDLVEGLDPERGFALKIDGATKELVFFGSRVGFVTHGGNAAADEAMLSKFKFFVRGTVGSPSGPALAMIDRLLAAPDLEATFETRRKMMQERYLSLKRSLAEMATDTLVPYPFNSAFFALLQAAPGIDVELVRQRLIAEYSVGSIAFASHGCLRLAFCSITGDAIPELVRRVVACVSTAPRGPR